MTDRESYIRQETVTGVVPMLKGDRQYSFLDLYEDGQSEKETNA